MTDVTDRNQNRTEPNRWPPRMGRSDAIPRTGARARVTEVEEGSPLTGSEDWSGKAGFLAAVREHLIGDGDRIWPTQVPTAADLMRYGAGGQQLAPGSKLRPFAKGYARVGVGQTWSHYARAWVWQRPLRLLALITVIVLVNVLIPGSTPLWVWAFTLGFLL